MQKGSGLEKPDASCAEVCGAQNFSSPREIPVSLKYLGDYSIGNLLEGVQAHDSQGK